MMVVVATVLWSITILWAASAAEFSNSSTGNRVLVINSNCSEENFDSSSVFPRLQEAVVHDGEPMFSLDVRDSNSSMVNSSMVNI